MAKGFGMGGMFRDMQKQAEGMQKRMADLQNDLKERVYEGTAGGGTVTVHVNGQRDILAVKIAKEAVDPDEVEMLEDLVKVAVSQAMKKAADAYAEAMSKITGGMNIPGMF
jgi:nucleoid-associated protein EbfC